MHKIFFRLPVWINVTKQNGHCLICGHNNEVSLKQVIKIQTMNMELTPKLDFNLCNKYKVISEPDPCLMILNLKIVKFW